MNDTDRIKKLEDELDTIESCIDSLLYKMDELHDQVDELDVTKDMVILELHDLLEAAKRNDDTASRLRVIK